MVYYAFRPLLPCVCCKSSQQVVLTPALWQPAPRPPAACPGAQSTEVAEQGL